MEPAVNEIKCRYCHYRFVPEPQVRKVNKKLRTYIECPQCGNGIERAFRWYDKPRKVVVVNG